MNIKFTRRSFVTTALSGLGIVAMSHPLATYISLEDDDKNSLKKKKLLATTDFLDNVVINERGSRYGKPVERSDEYYRNNQCFMDRKQLDELHKFLASLGVTRHQWIVDTIWTLYENYPHGFDLLEEAAKSAHKQGIEFYAVIKPFEGGGFGNILPLTMPFPKGAVAFRDIRGIFPIARPFEAANLSLNLKRKAGTYECNSIVSAIRLVKGDDLSTRIKGEDLSLFTSSTNNQFIPYNGPVTFRETVEPRYRFPYWRKNRILHLENLKIPEGHNYFLIRCDLSDDKADFGNEKGNIIELVGSNGNVLPHTLSTGQVTLDKHLKSFYQSKVMQKMVRYLQLPEVQAEINDLQKMEEHYRDFYSFGEYNLADLTYLDKEGFIAAACGKPEYTQGNLHPIYPEVREYWLDMVRFCLDRKVDGINLRISNHTLSPEYWDYGFNDEVLNATEGKTDFQTVSKINGDAYTFFIREAQKLIKSRDKSLTIHLNTDLLMPDDRPGKLKSFPFNFDWQWEKWVKEIGDEFEIRGIFQLRPWNLKKILDIFSNATRSFNKPLCLQGDFHGMTFEGPFFSTVAETKLVNEYEGLDGYVFYETANITRINDEGHLEGSPEIKDILNNYNGH